MKSLIVNLHNAARRYCMDKYQYWSNKYLVLINEHGSSSSTEEAEDIYPRYNVLKAILDEVEKYTPADFSSLEEARKLISLAGRDAAGVLTQNTTSLIKKSSMMDERDAFIHFIQNASEQEVALIEVLSYRRILKPDEKQLIWETLKGIWKIKDHYWYPLVKSEIEQIAAFRIDDSTKNFFQDGLLPIIAEKRITRLFEIREGGIAYEEDLALFDPEYDGTEGYWFDRTMEWIIYISHEESITIGGWLLEEVKMCWPVWKDKIWQWPI